MRSAVFFSLLMAARTALAFEITSPAFTHESNIPAQYTCDGVDWSPPLRWTDSPEGAKSFVLIVDDPDAPRGIWVHWVVYNIPVSLGALAEGIPPSEKLDQGMMQGVSDYGRFGYGGPCPPPGGVHRYYFKLYALDTLLNLPSRQTKTDLLRAMEKHVLAEAAFIGKYERKR
jgi:Raf kinase inhibitor-like YbhB/YbcL family protein